MSVTLTTNTNSVKAFYGPILATHPPKHTVHVLLQLKHWKCVNTEQEKDGDDLTFVVLCIT